MGSNPIAEPRLAATVLLLRDSDDGMEVFMVVRHHQIEFASGALVFPGGRIDPGDHAIAADPALFPAQPGLAAAAAALRVGALRETFEECGILLARERGELADIGHAAARDRASLARRHDHRRENLCRHPGRRGSGIGAGCAGPVRALDHAGTAYVQALRYDVLPLPQRRSIRWLCMTVRRWSIRSGSRRRKPSL